MSVDRSVALYRSAFAPPGTAPARRGPSANVVSLTPFLTLARELAALIAPVHLRNEFRNDLGRNLLVAARQQYARERVMSSPVLPVAGTKISRRWAIGAATVGSAVSVASLLAFVVNRRRRLAA